MSLLLINAMFMKIFFTSFFISLSIVESIPTNKQCIELMESMEFYPGKFTFQGATYQGEV